MSWPGAVICRASVPSRALASIRSPSLMSLSLLRRRILGGVTLRWIVRASAKGLREWSCRRYAEVRFVSVFIDGIQDAGETLVVALGLAADGTKHVLGLRQGATENAEVVTSLLERPPKSPEAAFGCFAPVWRVLWTEKRLVHAEPEPTERPPCRI